MKSSSEKEIMEIDIMEKRKIGIFFIVLIVIGMLIRWIFKI